jgi:small ubiquitin-related modifier
MNKDIPSPSVTDTPVSNTPEPKEHQEPEKPVSDRHIGLVVVSQDGNEVHFKIKQNTPLRKLMDAYCSRAAISMSSVRFLYDGCRVQEDDTPTKLEMEEADIIDVVMQQTGG